MQLDLQEKQGVSILVLTGSFAAGGDREFREAVDTLIEAGRTRVLLDFKDVTFIDSSGIGELVAAYRTIKRLGGALKILSPSVRVQDSLNVTRLLPIFEVHDDEATALASFADADD